MHELGIVFHIIDTVEQVGRENGVTQVRCVTLDVGQMLRGARLQIEPVHAVTLCDACGKTYDTVPQGRTCPYCGSGDTHLLQGNACSIREIEAR